MFNAFPTYALGKGENPQPIGFARWNFSETCVWVRDRSLEFVENKRHEFSKGFSHFQSVLCRCLAIPIQAQAKKLCKNAYVTLLPRPVDDAFSLNPTAYCAFRCFNVGHAETISSMEPGVWLAAVSFQVRIIPKGVLTTKRRKQKVVSRREASLRSGTSCVNHVD